MLLQDSPACMSNPDSILILDTETTALEPKDGALIEVGAILFSVQDRAVVAQASVLFRAESNEAESVNGISPALLRRQTPGFSIAGFEFLEAMARKADLYVAHNADFDRKWLEYHQGDLLGDRPWVCSMKDIQWPQVPAKHSGRVSVTNLALAYGVPVWAAHRALTDCFYLAQVMEREPALEDLLIDAQSPKALFRAHVTYDQRDLAKQSGFSWDAGRKQWTKKLSPAKAQELPFKVSEIQS